MLQNSFSITQTRQSYSVLALLHGFISYHQILQQYMIDGSVICRSWPQCVFQCWTANQGTCLTLSADALLSSASSTILHSMDVMSQQNCCVGSCAFTTTATAMLFSQVFLPQHSHLCKESHMWQQVLFLTSDHITINHRTAARHCIALVTNYSEGQLQTVFWFKKHSTTCRRTSQHFSTIFTACIGECWTCHAMDK